MANVEDLNAISTLHEDGLHGVLHPDNGEWVDLLTHHREPVRDPVAIRGAGNVTVYVITILNFEQYYCVIRYSFFSSYL